MKRRIILILLVATSVVASPVTAQEKKNPDSYPWWQFIEPDFPFFSTAVDTRSIGAIFNGQYHRTGADISVGP